MPKGTKLFDVRQDPDTGDMLLAGRPDFLARAKAIEVNQDQAKGELEDRRHMLHWDEQLKPILDSVWSALKGLPPAELVPILTNPLKARKLTRLPSTVAELWKRVATELNSACVNLVAGRADINKAIEIVRERVRRVTRRLTDDSALVARVGEAGRGPHPNDTIMDLYKDMAIEELLAPSTTGDSRSPINSQVTAIGFEIVGLLEGCHAPCNFIMMLHHAADSVTFDLSEKARREQTAATLAWLRRMEGNVRQPGPERYEALLTLLD